MCSATASNQSPISRLRLMAAPGECYGHLDFGAKVQQGYANRFARLCQGLWLPKRSIATKAISGREVGENDGALDFLVGHFSKVGLTVQPAMFSSGRENS